MTSSPPPVSPPGSPGAPNVARARVLVVDDSAFARKVLRESLNGSMLLEVVGIARDGLEALEKIVELAPDVITLDLMMPNLDGLGVLRELLTARSKARVVLVSSSDRDSEVVVEALRLGAFDVVKKPTPLATDLLYDVAGELVRKVEQAARAPASGPLAVPKPLAAREVAAAEPTHHGVSLVVIGTSTGGPHALARLLPMLPADFPVPIAVALHIPSDYTSALARRLDEDSRVHVVEAQEDDDTPLAAGVVVLARGGVHLRIVRRANQLFARTSREPANADYFPSVDVLFETAAHSAKAGVLGVVLTGMGNDGARGAQAIAAAGGVLITESADTCVVYGMPRCIEELGLSARALRLDDIAAEIVRRVERPVAASIPRG
jgi:two-component system chemotaxis response regulator CheB